PVNLEGLNQGFLNETGDSCGISGRRNLAEQHPELLFCEACSRVVYLHHLLYTARYLSQDLVTIRVTQTTRHDLQIIETDRQHRERTLGISFVAIDSCLDAVQKKRSRRQSGERIIYFALGDISLRSGHSTRFAAVVHQSHTARQHPAIRAVAAEDAVFAFEMRSRSFQVRHQLALYSRAVDRMQPPKPFLGVLADLF